MRAPAKVLVNHPVPDSQATADGFDAHGYFLPGDRVRWPAVCISRSPIFVFPGDRPGAGCARTVTRLGRSDIVPASIGVRPALAGPSPTAKETAYP